VTVPGEWGGGGADFLKQDLGVITDIDEPSDRFGASLATADLDANGTDDLLIGVPGNGIEGVPRGGYVLEQLGSVGGSLGDVESDLYFQEGAGELGDPEDGDFFGSVLAR